jgi:hypothetical protein
MRRGAAGRGASDAVASERAGAPPTRYRSPSLAHKPAAAEGRCRSADAGESVRSAHTTVLPRR